jgi:hypothetical protein
MTSRGIVFDSIVECQRVVARNDLGKVWCAAASMADAEVCERYNMTKRLVRLATFVAASVFGASVASAGTVAYNLAFNLGGGNTLNASATFTSVNGQLKIGLVNTDADAVGTTAHFVSALFWDYTGSTLTKTTTSAAVAAGSSVVASTGNGQPFNPAGIAPGPNPGPNNWTGNINQYWAFRNDISALVTQSYGVGAAGFSIFGPGDMFASGVNNQPDGSDFLLIPSAQLTATSNGMANGDPFVRRGVDFTLTAPGLTAGMSNAQLAALLTNVRVQWGTSLSDPTTTSVVPLPAAAWMGMSLLGGVGGVGFFRRRRLVEA